MELTYKYILTELGSTEHVLESISLLKVPYGTDGTNQQWGRLSDPIMGVDYNYTIFHFHHKQYVVIVMDDGQVKFNTIEHIPKTPDDYYEFTQFKQVQVDNIFLFFGSVFYIIKCAMDDLKMDQFFFSGRNSKLQRTYERMVENGPLKTELKRMGFEYTGKDDSTGNLCFNRILKK